MSTTTYEISDSQIVEIEHANEELLGTATETRYQAITLEKLEQFGKASGIIGKQDLAQVANVINNYFEDVEHIIDNIYIDMSRQNWSELFLTLYSENIESKTIAFLASFLEMVSAKDVIFETPTLIRINW